MPVTEIKLKHQLTIYAHQGIRDGLNVCYI